MPCSREECCPPTGRTGGHLPRGFVAAQREIYVAVDTQIRRWPIAVGHASGRGAGGRRHRCAGHGVFADRARGDRSDEIAIARVRYLADGSLDPAFGRLVVSPPPPPGPRSRPLPPGRPPDQPPPTHRIGWDIQNALLITRYHADGEIDASSVGTRGALETEVPGGGGVYGQRASWTPSRARSPWLVRSRPWGLKASASPDMC